MITRKAAPRRSLDALGGTSGVADPGGWVQAPRPLPLPEPLPTVQAVQEIAAAQPSSTAPAAAGLPLAAPPAIGIAPAAFVPPAFGFANQQTAPPISFTAPPVPKFAVLPRPRAPLLPTPCTGQCYPLPSLGSADGTPCLDAVPRPHLSPPSTFCPLSSIAHACHVSCVGCRVVLVSFARLFSMKARSLGLAVFPVEDCCVEDEGGERVCARWAAHV